MALLKSLTFKPFKRVSVIFGNGTVKIVSLTTLTGKVDWHIMTVMRVKMVLYDEETGQVLETVDKAIFFGHKAFLDKGYVKIFVAFLRDILEDEEVLKGPAKLLLYAINLMDYNSLQVAIAPQQAMKDLDISEKTFYRWLKTLLTKGYMEKIATNIYRLKPYTAIKGQMRRVPDLGFFERQ